MLACSRHGSVDKNCCRFMKITQAIVSFLLQIYDGGTESGIKKYGSPYVLNPKD
jgi:hypothetical protein